MTRTKKKTLSGFARWHRGRSGALWGAAAMLMLCFTARAARAGELLQRPGTSHFVSAVGRRAFKDPRLVNAQVVTEDFIGEGPVMYTGRFAAVFKLMGQDGRPLALRCFRRDSQFAHEHSNLVVARYQVISEQVSKRLADFKKQGRRLPLLPVELIREGIQIGAEWHPVVLTPWHEGQRIDNAVEDLVDDGDKQGLRELARHWRRAILAIDDADIGHGDLQHGNARVDPGNSAITLIDYDPMWLPALRQQPVVEHNPHYQHPGRTTEYGKRVDSIPSTLIYLSLIALAEDPTRWDRRAGEESLLLIEDDLINPQQSPMLDELRQSQTSEVKHLAGRLTRLLEGPMEKVPLFSEILEEFGYGDWRAASQLVAKTFDLSGRKPCPLIRP